jgi:hypothetical protein
MSFIKELLEMSSNLRDFKVEIYRVDDEDDLSPLTSQHLEAIKLACEHEANASGEPFTLKKAILRNEDEIQLVISAPSDTDEMGIEEVIYNLQVNDKLPRGYSITCT